MNLFLAVVNYVAAIMFALTLVVNKNEKKTVYLCIAFVLLFIFNGVYLLR